MRIVCLRVLFRSRSGFASVNVKIEPESTYNLCFYCRFTLINCVYQAVRNKSEKERITSGICNGLVNAVNQSEPAIKTQIVSASGSISLFTDANQTRPEKHPEADYLSDDTVNGILKQF